MHIILPPAARSRLAQLVERGTVNPEAIGSIPIAREDEYFADTDSYPDILVLLYSYTHRTIYVPHV